MEDKVIKIALPKGRLFPGVYKLLQRAGLGFTYQEKKYHYIVVSRRLTVHYTIIKNRDISHCVADGIFDAGFSSYDWIKESGADVREMLDLKFGKVKLVLGLHNDFDVAKLDKRTIVCATEYPITAEKYLKETGLKYKILTTHGASEGYVPDSAEMILDVYETGNSFRINDLHIWKELFDSTVRFMVNKKIASNKSDLLEIIKKEICLKLKEE